MRTVVAVACMLFSGLLFAEDFVIKPTGKEFKNTAPVAKWMKEHKDQIACELHLMAPGIDEPDFKTGGVMRIRCSNKKSKKNPQHTGATVDEIVDGDELKVSIDTILVIDRQITQKDAANQNSAVRKAVNQDLETAQIDGDLEDANGLSLTQRAALRSQSTVRAGDVVTENKNETREYVLKGFDTSKLKIGDKIAFDGLFQFSEGEKGERIIEPFRP